MGLKIISDNHKKNIFPRSEEMDIPRLPTDLIISILKERKNMIEKEKQEIKNNKIKFNNTIKELNKFYDCFFDQDEYLEEYELNWIMMRVEEFKKGGGNFHHL